MFTCFFSGEDPCFVELGIAVASVGDDGENVVRELFCTFGIE